MAESESWLKWKQVAEGAQVRAVTARRDADRWHDEAIRARSSRRYWRRTAIAAWAWPLLGIGEWSWHWSSWCAFPVAAGAVLIGFSIDSWDIRRPRRED